MRERLRQAGYLVGYLGLLAAAFAGALVFLDAAGARRDAAEPAAAVATPSPSGPSVPPTPAPGPDSSVAPSVEPSALPAGGQTEAGQPLSLALDRADVGVGVEERLRIEVRGADGAPAAALSDAPIRLAVVRRDLASYDALAAEPDGVGAWTAVLTLPAAGPYRVLAEIVPADRAPVVLGADLVAAGEYVPAELPPPAPTAATRRYLVSMAGEPRTGDGSELTFTVTDGGAPVTDLLPLDGPALGSAAAVRAVDLAPVRVTARTTVPGASLGGPAMVFVAAFPGVGTYRLFVDFQRAVGRRHTVAFTVVVPH